MERRLAPRRNTMIEAVAVFDGGRGRMPCIIRDLSDTGARLEILGAVAQVPNTFDLMAPRHHPHACRVVWRALREIGVHFTD